MYKKYLYIVIALIVLIGVYLYIRYQDLHPKGTGAIITPISVEELEFADATRKLQQNLPVQTNSFNITNFDYKRGKFIVRSTNTPAKTSEDISSWLITQGYQAIPLKMFEVIN